MIPYLVILAQVGETKEVVSLVEHGGTIAVLTIICIAQGAYIFWMHRSFNTERAKYISRIFDAVFLISDVIKRFGQAVKGGDKAYLDEKVQDMLENWNRKNSDKEI